MSLPVTKAYYRLRSDVYLVRGAARSAIYDFNESALYSISSEIADLIVQISSRAFSREECSDEQWEVVEQLLEGSLIETTEAASEPLNLKETLRQPVQLDFAWVEVTRQCNLRCHFCYEGSNPHCVERLSFEDFKVVVSNLVEANIRAIQFIGGEPTVLKETLKEMIRYARPHFDFMELYTNGVLLDDDWCEFLKLHQVHVAISIHSYIPEQHDKVTQVKGSHRKVLRGLSLLEKYHIPYRIGTVETKSCQIGQEDKEAPTSYRLRPQLPKVASYAETLDFDFDMFERKAITKQTKSRAISKAEIIKNVSGHQCFSHEVYISSLLDVFPCVMERRKSYGNLHRARLVDIVDDDIRLMTKDDVNGCRDCEYRYSCFDCRPDAMGKGFSEKPWFCSYDPSTGSWADLKKMYQQLNARQKLQLIPIVAGVVAEA